MPNECQHHNTEWLAKAIEGWDWKGQSCLSRQFHVKSVMKQKCTDSDTKKCIIIDLRLLLFLMHGSTARSAGLDQNSVVYRYQDANKVNWNVCGTKQFVLLWRRNVWQSKRCLLRGLCSPCILFVFALTASCTRWCTRLSRHEPSRARHWTCSLSVATLSHRLTWRVCFL